MGEVKIYMDKIWLKTVDACIESDSIEAIKLDIDKDGEYHIKAVTHSGAQYELKSCGNDKSIARGQFDAEMGKILKNRGDHAVIISGNSTII